MEPAPFSAGNFFIGTDIRICIDGFNGAGAFQRRKRAAWVGVLTYCRASMEPAPFSAGNRPERNASSEPQRASMEPAPFSAGNCRISGCDRKHRSSFNGAGAFQRRKLGRDVLLRLDVLGASMEPAPFSAGNPSVVIPVHEVAVALQWSRRLSAPETGHLWRTVTGGSARRFNGAGAFQRRKPAELLADSAWENIASMEPAPFSAGNPPPCRTLSSRHRLQWSRRLSAPETTASYTSSLPSTTASMEPAPFSAGNRP